MAHRPFDDVDADLPRRSLKWTMHEPDVLAAWVAEMDVEAAPSIRDALTEAVARGDFGYPGPDGSTGLPEVCAAYFAQSFGWAVDPGSVRLVSEVLRGVAAAIELFSPPGSPVVLSTPAYPPFFDVIRRAGRAVVEVPMRPTSDGGRTLDVDAVGAQLATGARTVLLCNPDNPTGTAYTRDTLAALASTVDEHGARVVADEVHAPLTYPGHRHVPYASVSPQAAAHSVTVTSASKGWNLPGLKCAQVVLTAEADVRRWEELPAFERFGASPLGIVANRAAYASGAPWLAAVLDHLDGNRRLLAELLATHLPDAGYHVPQATYLGWLDCRPLGLVDPAAFFLDMARVAVSDGAEFGAAGRGHVRLNFGTSRRVLVEIVERMGAAVRSRAPGVVTPVSSRDTAGVAYDVDLADRLREILAREPGVVEKPMFGGLAFLVAGHMAVSASRLGGLLLRVDPTRTDTLVDDPRASRFVMRGREMDGWLRIDIDARASDDELNQWVEHGVGYARSLPPKE